MEHIKTLYWAVKSLYKTMRFADPATRWIMVVCFVTSAAAAVYQTYGEQEYFRAFLFVLLAVSSGYVAWPTMMGKNSDAWRRGPFTWYDTVYLDGDLAYINAEAQPLLKDKPIVLVEFDYIEGYWLGVLEKPIVINGYEVGGPETPLPLYWTELGRRRPH